MATLSAVESSPALSPKAFAHNVHIFFIIWRSQGVTIPFFNSDSVVCVHEHFETNWYEKRDSNPYALRRQILSLLRIPFRHSRINFGGSGWIRTNNVFPEGTDLQSADAHAIASTNPAILKNNYIKKKFLNQIKKLARPEGFEPPLAVLETVVLPLTLGTYIGGFS